MSWFNRNMSDKVEQKIEAMVREIVTKALSNTETMLAKLREAFALEKKLVELKEELETLRIEKGRKDEEYAKKDREIEHKVGLERQRQKFELEQAKREATVTVREEALKANQERFTEQLKFHEDRFTQEVGYLKGMVEEMLKRLPSASISVKGTVK